MSVLTLLGCATEKPRTPFAAAQRYYEAGQETEARRALASELALRPNNLTARYNLAVLLTRIGDTNAARKLYEENMRRGWHLPTVVNLSALYAKTGEYEKARRLLQNATKHFPHEAVPWYMLAEIDIRQGQSDAARRDFKRAVAVDPKNGYAEIRYARFLASRGDIAGACAHSARAVKLLPGVAPSWMIRGDILSRASRYHDALTAYQKSAALAPGDKIRERIIAVLHKLGEDGRANRMQQALDRETGGRHGGR